MMERKYKPLKGERMQLRLDSETQWRIKEMAKFRHCSMTTLIETLVNEAWLDQMALPGFAREQEKTVTPWG